MTVDGKKFFDEAMVTINCVYSITFYRPIKLYIKKNYVCKYSNSEQFNNDTLQKSFFFFSLPQPSSC